MCEAEKPPRMPPRFNCKFQTQVLNIMTVGVVNGTSLNTTQICEAPFLTNNVGLLAGEELLLEVNEPADKKDKKRSWRDAHADANTQEIEAKKKKNGDRI